MKEALRYGFVLGLICLASSGLLAIVNGFSAPQIKIQKEKEENAALKAVFPDAATFKAHMSGDKLGYYLVYDSANQLKGFAIKAVGKGYSSDIEVLASLDLELQISAVKILSASETPGLGSRVSEPGFTDQFKGKSLNSIDEVQAITGATVSSRAVIDSVKNKISQLSEQLEKEIL